MPLGDLTPQKETKPIENKSIQIGGVPQTKTKIFNAGQVNIGGVGEVSKG
jgi:hypothetical protein